MTADEVDKLAVGDRVVSRTSNTARTVEVVRYSRNDKLIMAGLNRIGKSARYVGWAAYDRTALRRDFEVVRQVMLPLVLDRKDR